MGIVNLIHDESWRAARLVVGRFRDELDDEEIVAQFEAFRAIVADAMRRLIERRNRELQRLNPNEKSHYERPDERPV